MADTNVATDHSSNSEDFNSLWGPYWIDKDKGLIIRADGNVNVAKSITTDGGATWDDSVAVTTDGIHFACWFDRDTPGDMGTIVHVVWLDYVADTFHYVDIDVNGGGVGTERTIESSLTVSVTGYQQRCAITKTVSGNLIAAMSTQAEIHCAKSEDDGATWIHGVADVYETGTEEDWLLLFPACTADDNDACGLFWDRSINEISIKMFDDSSGTSGAWTESTGDPNAIDDIFNIQMDAAVRHSDGAILLANHGYYDNAADDLTTWEIIPDSIADPTVTEKTEIFTNQTESAQAAIIINQQNNDVYVAWFSGAAGGGTWQSEVDIWYSKSDDDMANWSAPTQVNEDTADDSRMLHGGRTISASGGRIQFVWYLDDLSDSFVNLNNDIEIAAEAAPVGITRFAMNVGDSWKHISGATAVKINIDDSWKAVNDMQLNVGDAWKVVTVS